MPPLPPDRSSGNWDGLARLRGRVPPQPYSARKITALTENPACGRRAVLDAAGIDKATLALRVGHQPRFGQSPFALSRAQDFLAWSSGADSRS